MKALIVVDCQNDFLLSRGSLGLGHDTGVLREKMAKFIDNFDGSIYVTKDTHAEDDCEFNVFPKHCIRDTWGHRIIKEIDNVLQRKNHTSLEKKSYTGDIIHVLADELADEGIQEIHLVGVCLHICVHDIVGTLVNYTKEKYNYIPQIIIHKELVDDFDQEMAEFALKRMESLYGAKIETKEV